MTSALQACNKIHVLYTTNFLEIFVSIVIVELQA